MFDHVRARMSRRGGTVIRREIQKTGPRSRPWMFVVFLKTCCRLVVKMWQWDNWKTADRWWQIRQQPRWWEQMRSLVIRRENDKSKRPAVYNTKLPKNSWVFLIGRMWYQARGRFSKWQDSSSLFSLLQHGLEGYLLMYLLWMHLPTNTCLLFLKISVFVPRSNAADLLGAAEVLLTRQL